MEKIKVCAVSYLNTKPFMYGLEHSDIINHIELTSDTPSKIAEKLVSGNATIGLVPTVSIPEIPKAEIIGRYCIACDGEVGSVCIYSQVPMKELKSIYLDYQSRTSVELARILLRDFWKVTPELIDAAPGYESLINQQTGGLIIGDRSLQLRSDFNYCYDLGRAWKDLTGLPFVFACWVSNKKLSTEFIESFNASLERGIKQIPEVAKQSAFFYPGIDTLDYLSRKIQFYFSENMKSGMNAFLQQLKSQQNIHAG